LEIDNFAIGVLGFDDFGIDILGYHRSEDLLGIFVPALKEF
jgi:hypothetical protein